MVFVDEQSIKASESDDAVQIKVLAVSLPNSGDLGAVLEDVLRATTNIAFSGQKLSAKNPTGCAACIIKTCDKAQPDLLLLCLGAEDFAGAEAVLGSLRNHPRGIPVVVVSQSAKPAILHRLVLMGAADFCLAPLRLEDLLPRLMRWYSPASETTRQTGQLLEELGLQQFLGKSRVFLEILHQIPKLARCDASVFITGETGTGKEMCARAIHQLGPRNSHPFIPVNCGAIPSELVENELFGHEAGSFTGASSAEWGLIRDAEGGTLFLDEIDSLPLQIQVKLLRFLQNQEYRPLGARKCCQSNIRVIAACNADIEELVHAGRFRQDLYYRLNILPLKLAPLRERPEDIPLLAAHFVRKYAGEFSAPVKELSGAAMEKLLAHRWPGNVRELENIIKRALAYSEQSLITGADICLPGEPVTAKDSSFKSLKIQAIADFEMAFVRKLLAVNNGNISQAARAAKKNRRAFWQLMRKHDIAAPGAAPRDYQAMP